ncbi:hypothetical protein AAUPMC_18339, partial [Pasteurella multocida subsp. multocida str. Anand1_cattle]
FSLKIQYAIKKKAQFCEAVKKVRSISPEFYLPT